MKDSADIHSKLRASLLERFAVLYLAVMLSTILSACSVSAGTDSRGGDEKPGVDDPEPTTVYRIKVPEFGTTPTPPEPTAATGAERGSEANVAVGDSPDGLLRVTFLDVGQGSGILVRLPNGANVLVDGGPREVGDEVVAFHAREDHAGRLIDER